MKQNARPAGPALKHSLGQNFILDPALQQELAGLTSLGPDDEVLEIGAGSGMLTQALADRVKHVTAVELDREMIPYLKAAVLSRPNVTVLRQDILRMDWQAFAKETGPFHIAANLPYHVTTALLTQLTGQELPILSMHLMLQKESAEKLCAEEVCPEACSVDRGCYSPCEENKTVCQNNQVMKCTNGDWAVEKTCTGMTCHAGDCHHEVEYCDGNIYRYCIDDECMDDNCEDKGKICDPEKIECVVAPTE